jgi:septal ring factor EnvC (AmiA/AmiB activator)
VGRLAAWPGVNIVATPTQLDRIEAAIAALKAELDIVRSQNNQQTSLLNAISTGVQIMSDIATSTDAAVTDLDAKVDTFLAAVSPTIQGLRDALAAAQAQVAALQAGDAADAALLGGTLAHAQAEAAKVQAAIDALTPPATP